jgi:hypothetical protein
VTQQDRYLESNIITQEAQEVYCILAIHPPLDLYRLHEGFCTAGLRQALDTASSYISTLVRVHNVWNMTNSMPTTRLSLP